MQSPVTMSPAGFGGRAICRCGKVACREWGVDHGRRAVDRRGGPGVDDRDGSA